MKGKTQVFRAKTTLKPRLLRRLIFPRGLTKDIVSTRMRPNMH